MQLKEFDELHKSKGVTHIWVAQRIKIMSDPLDKAGEMKWSRIRTGDADFPKRYRGRKVGELAEIYGVNVDKIIELFGLTNERGAK